MATSINAPLTIVTIVINAPFTLTTKGEDGADGGPFEPSMRTITADDTVLDTDYTILMNGSANTVDLLLPEFPVHADLYQVKAVNVTFTCRVLGNGNSIEGTLGLPVIFGLGQALTFQYSTTYGWAIV